MFNGTWNNMFFDDMESGGDLWILEGMYYSCHWHEEDTFGAPYPGLDGIAFWNGQANGYMALAQGLLNETDFNFGVPSYMTEVNVWPLAADPPYIYDAGTYAYYTVDYYGGQNVWLNQTGLALPVSTDLKLDFLSWGYTGFYPTLYDMYWVTIDDGVTPVNFPVNGPSFGPDTPQQIDLTPWAGMTIDIDFHFNGTFFDPYAYGFNEVQVANITISGLLPDYMLPYENYYNNVDEKLVFCFDLTKAYQATLFWEQNYSFADLYPDDYGLVEISTDGGTTWKTLLIIAGSSTSWSLNELDISDYVGGDDETCVRFRFISNETQADYGWLVDNVSITGKVDYKDPTIACSLSPVAPNGNCDWYKTGVTFTAEADDNVDVDEILYRIDGGAWKTYTGPITISVDGTHTVEAYAIDEVGNPSEICTETFKIDATAPTVSITGPQDGYIYLFGRELFANPLGGTIIIGGIDFSATASDAMSGIDYVSFAVDGMSYEKATSPYTIYWEKFDLLPASYTLTVSAYDIAGNKGSDDTLSFTHWL